MSDEEEMPFGEDIRNPDARLIPSSFHGSWCSNGKKNHVIEAQRLIIHDSPEDVVAVRFIGSQERIALVTRQSDGSYALHYRGLEGSDRLIDLESADMVYERC